MFTILKSFFLKLPIQNLLKYTVSIRPLKYFFFFFALKRKTNKPVGCECIRDRKYVFAWPHGRIRLDCGAARYIVGRGSTIILILLLSTNTYAYEKMINPVDYSTESSPVFPCSCIITYARRYKLRRTFTKPAGP